MDFFKSQDIARKNTGRLVVFFSLAVIFLIILTNLLVMAVFGYFNIETLSAETTIALFNWEIFLKVGAVVIAVIALGSLYKIKSLSGGGARVAEMMNGELIVDGSGDINKQKILNVVEEMAIASGMPVPPVYLINEPGINAFAAGYSPSDAVIGVTRGAIETLSRDQLQGVVAHEFSHILNGDMRLNIRLIGILHGIMVIGIVGYYMLYSSSHSRRSKNGGGIIFLALGLLVIGYAGTFFGNLIKAGVSRQREYLADASAVQFTRSRDGIAGALKRIGGNVSGSILQNPNSAEISHSLFSQGITTYLSGLFATHPPLNKRIRKIQPDWNGQYDATSAADDQAPVKDEDNSIEYDMNQSGDTIKSPAMTTIAAVLASNAILENIGQPTSSHLEYARQLKDEMPDVLIKAAHEPFAARAVIYFLVLDDDEEIRTKQLQHLEISADSGVYEETIRLVSQVELIKPEYRLPLVEMSLATLRQLTKPQYKLFRGNLVVLIKADGQISLSEWAIQKIVFHHLDAVFSPAFSDKRSRSLHQRKSLAQTGDASSVLLSFLVYSSKQSGQSSQDVFDVAKKELDGLDVMLLAKDKLDLDKLNKALSDLVQLKPLVKPQLLKACAACITADKNITSVEAELFRAIADTLDCPMPPLVV